MYKFTKLLFVICSFVFAAVSSVYAASGDVSVKISQPVTPTSTNNFSLNVVTLDVLGRPVTVRCFKKGPSDASFSQFGSDVVVSAGGNTVNCDLSSVMSSYGGYSFNATAQAESDHVTSDTVYVEFISSGPDTPVWYSKDKVDSCTYKIRFKTANDSGKTNKVEIYRSEHTSFNTDAGTRVGVISIGSNLEGEFSNSLPDCNKTYYYAIRAFDSLGNGSGVIGDTEVVITSTTVVQPTTTTQTTQGAIVSGTSGNILGDTTKLPTTADDGTVLAEATQEAEIEQITPIPTAKPTQALTSAIVNHPVRTIGIVGILLAILYYVIFRQPKP